MSQAMKYVFNRTRNSFLATDLSVAHTHWTRLKGLLVTKPSTFVSGKGLWIIPSHGVHTFAMRFPIDVVYLDDSRVVLRLEENVKPWRVTPLVIEAASVLELPAHTIWDTSTKVGDHIEIESAAADTDVEGLSHEQRA